MMLHQVRACLIMHGGRMWPSRGRTIKGDTKQRNRWVHNERPTFFFSSASLFFLFKALRLFACAKASASSFSRIRTESPSFSLEEKEEDDDDEEEEEEEESWSSSSTRRSRSCMTAGQHGAAWVSVSNHSSALRHPCES